MPDARTGTLRTLGYRIPRRHIDTLLGQVASYPWDDRFEHAWKNLPKTTRRNGKGKPVSPAYRQLLTGLTAVHNAPVRIIPRRGLSDDDRESGVKGMIVAAGNIDPFHLTTCLCTFEQCLRGNTGLDTLTPVLPHKPTTRLFSDAVATAASGTATAPGWLFDCAVWGIMRRLATRPMLVGDSSGPRLKLRLDTDGALLTWDDPISNQWTDWTGYAMLRITANIITHPRVADLAVIFDAHLSRINNQWRGTKTTWIDRDDPALSLLRVPVRNIPPGREEDPWTTEVANHAAAIARACGMERLGLNLPQKLPDTPAAHRPLIPGPRIHPVGKGPGARLMLRLAEHIEATCPELQPLRWRRDSTTRIPTPLRQVLVDPDAKTKKKTANAKPDAKPRKQTNVQVTPEVFTAAAARAKTPRYRLLCLYATSQARHRMAQQLRVLSPQAAPPLDDQVHEVSAGLAISFHRVEDLLRHGTHDRTGPLTFLKHQLASEPGTSLAWVETEYDPRTGKPADDAKNPVRRHLARLGIPSQFLATPPADAPAPRRRKRSRDDDANTDHPALTGAADLLLRTAGVLHPKITSNILQDFLTDTGHSHIRLVGIHARLQQSPIEAAPPKLVLTATSVLAYSDPHVPWTVTMWSDDHHAWTQQPRAIADFHAGPIGSTQRGRTGEKVTDTRQHIESILDALQPGPVVLFMDALATRTIWPGLQNHHFSNGALPGINLALQRDVAIIRCNTSREVPRPVDRTGGRQPRTDHRQPAAPDRHVYRLDDSGVWLFPKSSRVYRAQYGRLGAQYTPWTLPEHLQHRIEDDWHAYTGTEIAVPRRGPWTDHALVTLTARLCDHTITWDDRTLAPLPLHLATRADRTHPEYRTDEEEET